MSELTGQDFEEVWKDIDSEARRIRFSQVASINLAKFYARLDSEDRLVADEVLADRVGGGDEAQRYEARSDSPVSDLLGVASAAREAG